MRKSDEELKKALKDLGDFGVVAGLEEAEKYPRVVPTTFAVMDFDLLKLGGLPYGKVVEIYGEPGTCKSMWGYQILGAAQKQDKRMVALVDTEYAIQSKDDWNWVKQNGVDIDAKRFRVVQDNSAETTFNQLLTLAESGLFSVIMIDSLGNMEPEDNMSGTRFETDKKTGKVKSNRPGTMASVTTTAIHRLQKALRNNHTLLLVINQVRDNMNPYSNEKWSTPGGRSFKHSRSVAIELVKLPDIKVGGNVEGHKIKAKVKRSRQCPPGETDDGTHLEFYLSGGNEKRELFEVYNSAVLLGFIVKKGAWIKCDSLELRWQGQEKALAEIGSNPDLLDKLKGMIGDKREIVAAEAEDNDESPEVD